MKKKSGSFKLAALLLAGLALILLWERSRGYLEPQQPVVTSAALVGHGLLEGRPFYSDLWDSHPPALGLSYAFAESLGGYGPYSIFLLNLFIAWGLLGALTFGGFAYGGVGAGLTAAALWTLVSGDLGLWANQPLAEGFANFFTACAFGVFLNLREDREDKGAWIVLGLLLAAASFYKLSVLVLVLLGCLLLWKNPQGPARFPKAILWILAPLAGTWTLVFIYFGLTGRFADFWGAVFSFNFYQLAQGGSAASGSFASFADFEKLWPGALKIGTPFLLTAFLGAGLAFAKNPRPWILWSAYSGWVLLETSASSFTAASYQCWLPPLVLGAAWGLFELYRWIQTWNPRLAILPAMFLFLFVFCREWPNYQLWAADWSRVKAGDGAVESYNLARNLDDVLKPGETFYEWGQETQLYYLTHRDPPSGVLTCDPLTQGPLAEGLSLRVAEDLRKSPPDLFLFNRGDALGNWAQNPVLTQLESNYILLKKLPASEGMLFFVRKGSGLAGRLSGAE